jgi:two-component system, NarL family, sensor kinase
MVEKDLKYLITVFVCIFFILVFIILLVFYIFNKRRVKYILEKQAIAREADNILNQAKIEIQEHLLKNLSWELHDNIGQLLSVSKMQLAMIAAPISIQDKKMLEDTIAILGNVLEEIRLLSKSLNTESIVFMGLAKAIQTDIDRLNRINFLKADLQIIGTVYSIYSNHEIILFRMVQEIITNVMKHAKASTLTITLHYQTNTLDIIAVDNGIGMQYEAFNTGIGLKNIASRSKFINASTTNANMPEGGLKTTISYPSIHTNNLIPNEKESPYS